MKLRCLLAMSCTAAALMFSGETVLAAQPLPTQEEMWRIIQQQSKQLEKQSREIEALKKSQGTLQASQTETESSVIETKKAVEETKKTASAAKQVADDATVKLAAAPSSSGGGWWDRTSIGGYGELHYEGGSKDQIDFHRFVLFFGHEFNDRLRFASEFELEHAFSGEEGEGPGEIELEQAFLQYDLTNQHRLNAGVQLVPVGILNLRHEPPTFFGVERNPIETNIIPTTWWEGGIGFSGILGTPDFSYDLLASSGLNVPLTGAKAFLVRSGRQRVAKAVAKTPSLTGRLRYTPIPGVELAASAHYEFDVTQDAGDPLTGEKVPGFLFSTHIDAHRGGFGLRALYASWWLDGTSARAIGRDRQDGFYVEPSYRFTLPGSDENDSLGDLGFFYRYSQWDNNAGISSLNTSTDQHIVGANFWPHPDVVFKADYFWEQREAGGVEKRLNLGIGYQF